ncbi:hypothetical protein [Streptomyces coelicoflavus]|uniref:hypothetical protein n=1 Tax=Streptomyces coelicoflavus TaxID=285562 RepID=UPI003F49F24D
MNSRTLLRSSASRRLLRPVADLIDQRIERRIRAADARRPVPDTDAIEKQRLTFELLVGAQGRGLSRTVAKGSLERLHREVAALAGPAGVAARVQQGWQLPAGSAYEVGLARSCDGPGAGLRCAGLIGLT